MTWILTIDSEYMTSKCKKQSKNSVNCTSSNLKLLCIKGHCVKVRKENLENGRKYFQIIYLIRSSMQEYIKTNNPNENL